MSNIDIKVKNECIKRIDNHITELIELKKMLNDGIETNEKVDNIIKYINDTEHKLNDMYIIRTMLCQYNHVLKMINN